MARICWICEREVAGGAPIKDDKVIRFIRSIKKKLGILKGNELVVCEEHIDQYKEKRRRFEKNLVLYATAAVILAVGLPLIPLILGGGFQLQTVCFSFILGAMILALSILNYVPALGKAKEKAAPRKRKKR